MAAFFPPSSTAPYATVIIHASRLTQLGFASVSVGIVRDARLWRVVAVVGVVVGVCALNRWCRFAQPPANCDQASGLSDCEALDSNCKAELHSVLGGVAELCRSLSRVQGPVTSTCTPSVP